MNSCDVVKNTAQYSIKMKILLILAASNLFYSPISFAIVTSNTGSDMFNGDYINALIGAETFYDAGYTGGNAVSLVVDAGHIWSGHDTLGKVTTFLDASNTLNGLVVDVSELGSIDSHGTSVGHMLAGAGSLDHRRGIAHGATLWSGAFAIQFTAGRTEFLTLATAFASPYEQALIQGVGGRKADVINSSFGIFQNANSPYALALDGMVLSSRATSVVSAGNSGPGAGTVNEAPTGYNSIAVGALGTDQNGYTTISDFSSRGPQDYVSPITGDVVPNVVARVDIVAPGQNITGALYGGTTGSNKDGTDITGGASNWYTSNVAGTSFAAPIVAGGATLLNDVAYDRFSNNVHARDGQVIKAVLLNSATKLDGWDNGQVDVNGVITTTQSLDYTLGAGALDLANAFNQYTGGTTDLGGLGGGAIETVGWDYGSVGDGEFVDYHFQDTLAAGGTFTATLNWFVGRSYSGTVGASTLLTTDDYFTDLSLGLYSIGDGDSTLVALSDAEYLNTEHLSFDLLVSGNYFLRVSWEGELYDPLNENDQQQYGLAWATVSAVPEPSAWAMMFLGVIFLLRKTNTSRKQAS